MSELLKDVVRDVVDELDRAIKKHGPQNTPHESYAVIKEELDEFWDEVKRQVHDKCAMRKELVQVAAMACRAIIDLRLR